MLYESAPSKASQDKVTSKGLAVKEMFSGTIQLASVVNIVLKISDSHP